MDETASESSKPPYELLGRFIHDSLKSWRSDLTSDPAVADALSETGLVDAEIPPNRTTIGRWRSGKSKPTKNNMEALADILLEGSDKHGLDLFTEDLESTISFLSDTEDNLRRWHHRPEVPKLAEPYLKEKWPEASTSNSSNTADAHRPDPQLRNKGRRLVVAASILAGVLVIGMLFSRQAEEPPAAVTDQATQQDAPTTQSVSIGGSADGATINQTIGEKE